MTGTVGIRHGGKPMPNTGILKILLSDWHQTGEMGQTKAVDIGTLLKGMRETAILFQYWLAWSN